MRAEASLWVVLAGEVMGQSTRGELGGRSDGTRGVTLLGGEACGCVARGAPTAVQYLGEVAWALVSLSSELGRDGITGGSHAGRAAVARPASIPARDSSCPRLRHRAGPASANA